MITLIPSILDDIEEITHFIETDPYHKDCIDPLWWLTGQGLLSFKAEDDFGTTLYVRTDHENDLLRIHCQFAPEPEVDRKRVVKTLLWGIPKMKSYAIGHGMIGLIYKSTSPELIEFMKRTFDFSPVSDDDHSVIFGQEG